jgi:hypothetical protein
VVEGIGIGWGLSISQQYRTLIAVWYAWRRRPTALYVVPSGTWSGDTYTGTIYRTTAAPNPFFGSSFNASAVSRIPVGTMQLRFINSANAVMTYTIDGATGSEGHHARIVLIARPRIAMRNAPALVLLCLSLGAWPQAYPAKPVRLVVPLSSRERPPARADSRRPARNVLWPTGGDRESSRGGSMLATQYVQRAYRWLHAADDGAELPRQSYGAA